MVEVAEGEEFGGEVLIQYRIYSMVLIKTSIICK